MAKAVVIVGFVVAFAAGLVVGFESRQKVAQPTTRPSHHTGWLAAELNLSPQQQERMREIWSKTAERGGRDRENRRRQLYRQRDEAIAALIRPEDKPRYEEILKSHADQLAALDREWRGSFQASVERTKEILTAEQRVKYEELLRRHESQRGSGERHHGERGRTNGSRGEHRSPSGPATQPDAGQQSG